MASQSLTCALLLFAFPVNIICENSSSPEVSNVHRYQNTTMDNLKTSFTPTMESKSVENAKSAVVPPSFALTSDGTPKLQWKGHRNPIVIVVETSLRFKAGQVFETLNVNSQLDVFEKYVVSMTNVVKSESIQKLTTGIFKVSEILEPALEVAAEVIDLILSNILDNPTQHEILNELNSIDNKLDAMRYEIEQLLAEISLEIHFDQIATQVTQLNSVKGQYSEWLKYADRPTQSRTQQFLTSCKHNGITDKPYFFYRIFVGNDDIRHPREMVINLGSTKKYRKFASCMVAYLLQASLLSGVCTGLQGNTTDIQVIIQQDAAIYGGYLNQTPSVIISDDLQIKSKFWVNALHDMDKHLANNSGRSHSEFAHAFHQYLTDKYDYREWLVISYGDETFFGEGYHWVIPTPWEQIYNNTDRSTFFYNIVRTGGRNVILASPSKIRPSFYPEMFSLVAKACFGRANLCPDEIFYAIQVAKKLNDCPLGSRFDPIIKFAFLDQSGFEIVNNSPLAAAQWLSYLTSYGHYYFVAVLIA